jgi:hypothetical protein
MTNCTYTYYDSGSSIWLFVDPMSDKYPNMSPYNYCANNPVILVDPDGKSIETSLTTNDDGSRVLTITYKAYIRNQSNTEISNSEMDSYINRITNSIESTWGKSPTDDPTLTVNVVVDIQVLPDNKDDIDFSRHLITFANLDIGANPPGCGDVSGMEMWIDINTVKNFPTDPLTGNSATATLVNGANISNSLERVAAHEFGHNAGLLDNNTLVRKIMSQSSSDSPGLNTLSNQLMQIHGISGWRNSPNTQMNTDQTICNKIGEKLYNFNY